MVLVYSNADLTNLTPLHYLMLLAITKVPLPDHHIVIHNLFSQFPKDASKAASNCLQFSSPNTVEVYFNIARQLLDSDFSNSVQLYIDILQLPFIQSIKSSVLNLLMPIVKQKLAPEYKSALLNNDVDFLSDYTRLVVELGDLACCADLSNDIDFINIMFSLTSYPGVFGIDESFSETTFSFWSSLLESFASDSTTTDTTNRKLIAVQVTKILIIKQIYPQNLSKSDSNTFASFRREAKEVFYSVWEFLNAESLDYIMTEIIQQCQSTPNPGIIESCLFSIRTFSELLNENESTYIPTLFNPQFIQWIKTSNVKLVKTFVALIGDLSEWFGQHPLQLESILSILTDSLLLPEICSVACNSLLSICDVNRNLLKTHVAILVTIPSRIHLNGIDKQRIIEAIASVVQAVGYPESIPHVLSLMDSMITDLKTILLQKDDEIVKGLIVDQVSVLTSFIRGLSTGSSIEPTIIHDKVIIASEIEIRVSTVLWECIVSIINRFANSMEVMSTISKFIDPSLCSAIPFFSPDLDSLIALITQTFKSYTHPSLLDTCNIVISYAKTHDQNPDQKIAFLVSEIGSSFCFWFDTFDKMEIYPDVVSSYFDLLVRVCLINDSLC